LRSDNYREFFSAPFLMGPNSLRLLDELLEEYPLQLEGKTALDLGCGTGITSLFLAKETGASVCAADLWIPEEDNRARFAGWGMADRLTPVNGDVRKLQFEKESFDAIISVDAYHYFGTEENFFADRILPWLKSGGTVLIAVPGIRNEYDGRSEELLSGWLGDEVYMFQSALSWKRIIGSHEDIAEVRTWEMAAFEQPWQEWFGTGHKYALGDLEVYDSIIRPRTAFVGIMVRKK